MLELDRILSPISALASGLLTALQDAAGFHGAMGSSAVEEVALGHQTSPHVQVGDVPAKTLPEHL